MQHTNNEQINTIVSSVATLASHNTYHRRKNHVRYASWVSTAESCPPKRTNPVALDLPNQPTFPNDNLLYSTQQCIQRKFFLRIGIDNRHGNHSRSPSLVYNVAARSSGFLFSLKYNKQPSNYNKNLRKTILKKLSGENYAHQNIHSTCNKNKKFIFWCWYKFGKESFLCD